MTISAYATVDDLGAYLGAEPPADSQRLLARAQDLIDDKITVAAYASDSSGNPTDATVLAALKKATCQQVEFWIATGDEFDQMRKIKSYSIEGISVTQEPEAGGSDEICPRTRATLRGAQLLPGTIFAT